MQSLAVQHLTCVTDNCNSQLEIECIRSVRNDCIEGFLHCNRCKVSYPIIDGIAIIVNDFANYASQRTGMLGTWLVKCKSDTMKKFLKEKAKGIRNVSQNRYEEGGVWFKPYLYMRSKARTDKHFSKIVDNNFDNFYAQIVDLILNKFSNSKMCLDLGCATGTVTHRLAKKLGFVFGVDQSFSFIREARKKNANKNLEFLVANSLELPFQKDKFDLLISLNVLDLLDPKEMLMHMSSMLQNNGRIVITDPYDFRDERGNPKNTYDSKSMRKFLVKNKFVIDKNTRNESFLPWVLRINKRAYLFYFTDLIIAKKLV